MNEELITSEQLAQLDSLFDLDRKIESDEDLIHLGELFDEDEKFMKNQLNLAIVGFIFLVFILGCSGANKNVATAPVTNAPGQTTAASSSGAVATPSAASEKPIAIQAKALTKDYDENEIAADGKYKGKMIAVTGKISNIAETMGSVTVQLEGHNIAKSVMCSFEEAELANVAKLKKGQQVTMVGKGDGMTMGLYAGLEQCKIQ